MALQMGYTTKSGIVLTDAYIKARTINERLKQSCAIEVGVYKDKTNADNDNIIETILPEPYEGIGFNFIPKVNTTAKNYREQAYEYLKTLDQFATATDV